MDSQQTNPDKQDRDKQDHKIVRRPYQKPRVQIYGDLRQITHTVQEGGINDNPGQETNMTQA